MQRGRTAAGWTAVGAAAVYVALNDNPVGGVTRGEWPVDGLVAAGLAVAGGAVALIVVHPWLTRVLARGGRPAPLGSPGYVIVARCPTCVQCLPWSRCSTLMTATVCSPPYPAPPRLMTCERGPGRRCVDSCAATVTSALPPGRRPGTAGTAARTGSW
ncbi:hypothetical protein GCM10010532_085790 [Dactylosporangium siamense]|uniref:Uncharacterized protein n=1 Tax=Dactylosporangium siamense TaxID=685454 RepID=A0A919UB47_9ACTN|nr:hypothetical protein Dsi01nite_068030 [Dactylosporangium siamense]